jgi:MFS family permease
MVASGPGQSFVISVFVDEMLGGTGLSRTAFSVLYAAGTVVSAAAMLAVGRLADRLGLRLLWIVVCLGLVLACVLASVAHGLLLAFFALALLRTFGQGSFPLLGTLLVARSFRGRRGQAMAAASLGLTVASVALPPAAVGLILAFGWRDAYRVLAIGLLVLVLPLAWLIRLPRRQGDEQDRATGKPQPSGYPRALRRSRTLPRLALPTRRAGRLLFVVAAPPLLLTAVIFHAVSLLGERGLSLAEASAALSLLGIANAVGTIAAGAVSDRMRTRRLLSVMSALLLASLLILLARSAAAAYFAFVLLGLGGGVFGVAAGIVWPRTYGLAEIGRLQGTATSVQIAAAAAGPLPLALSQAAVDSYEPALILLAAYAAVALLAALRWRDPRAVRVRHNAR